jgi:hypothetical protein
LTKTFKEPNLAETSANTLRTSTSEETYGIRRGNGLFLLWSNVFWIRARPQTSAGMKMTCCPSDFGISLATLAHPNLANPPRRHCNFCPAICARPLCQVLRHRRSLRPPISIVIQYLGEVVSRATINEP